MEKELNIFEAIQKVRLAMSKEPLQKNGYNAHLKYHYFEIGDFMPKAIEYLDRYGLCPIFNIGFDASGVEIATLTVVKGADRVMFQIPTAEVPNLQGIFALGGKDTYCKRYLYVNHLLDLTENDVAEEINGDKEVKVTVEEKKATPKQVELIRSLYDDENIAKMIEYYNVSSIEEMSLKQASEAIARKKK